MTTFPLSPAGTDPFRPHVLPFRHSPASPILPIDDHCRHFAGGLLHAEVSTSEQLMGVRLQQLYDEAAKIGGVKAQMRLAMLTGLTSYRAVEAKDSPEAIRKLESALARIKREM